MGLSLAFVKMKSKQAYYHDEKNFFEHKGRVTKLDSLKKVLPSELDSLK